jgi:hypothetical protein
MSNAVKIAVDFCNTDTCGQVRCESGLGGNVIIAVYQEGISSYRLNSPAGKSFVNFILLIADLAFHSVFPIL